MLTNLDTTTQRRFKVSSDEMSVFCRKWGIVSMALFGSILRPDFKQDSDIDLLIAFSSEARQGFLTLAKIKHELESMIGRSVDVSVKESIEESNNWIRRQEILATAQMIYEQR